jgi:hypothetical protein
MAVASAKFEAGQIFLPERASWLPHLEAELFSFPGSRQPSAPGQKHVALVLADQRAMGRNFRRIENPQADFRECVQSVQTECLHRL